MRALRTRFTTRNNDRHYYRAKATVTCKPGWVGGGEIECSLANGTTGRWIAAAGSKSLRCYQQTKICKRDHMHKEDKCKALRMPDQAAS